MRIEDVDAPRCVPGAERTILAQLAACGLVPDLPPVRQSERGALYRAAVDRLLAGGAAYRCGCSRADIVRAIEAAGGRRERRGELVYPGTCRVGGGTDIGSARAVRLRVGDGRVTWRDRRLGTRAQDVAAAVGDFVLRRADGWWAYQLAVVVDDAAQRVSDVVRGEDLADNTPRQIVLQRALGLATPRYLHVPLVLGPDGEKLSKGNGARAIDADRPLDALRDAGRTLGIDADAGSVPRWLERAAAAWPWRR